MVDIWQLSALIGAITGPLTLVGVAIIYSIMAPRLRVEWGGQGIRCWAGPPSTSRGVGSGCQEEH